jgi:hypothetical protein
LQWPCRGRHFPVPIPTKSTSLWKRILDCWWVVSSSYHCGRAAIQIALLAMIFWVSCSTHIWCVGQVETCYTTVSKCQFSLRSLTVPGTVYGGLVPASCCNCAVTNGKSLAVFIPNWIVYLNKMFATCRYWRQVGNVHRVLMVGYRHMIGSKVFGCTWATTPASKVGKHFSY